MKKYSEIFVRPFWLILIFVILFSSYLLFKVYPAVREKNRLSSSLQSNAGYIPTPEVAVKTSNDVRERYTSRSEFSPDGNYLVYLRVSKEADLWTVKVIISAQGLNYDVERNNPFNSPDYEIISLIKDQKEANKYSTDFQATWSPDSRKLAILLPNELIIYEFKIEEKIYKNDDTELVKKVLRTVSEQVIREGIPEFFRRKPANLTYFNNETTLVASTDDGLYQIWPIQKKIYDAEHSNFHKLPTDDGFSFFREPAEYGGYELVILKNGKENRYKTPIEGSIDWAGNIFMSPSLNHVCAEVGYSGHHGYVIFALGSDNYILEGQEYSYCGKWLDNYRVVVKEIPYFNQWTTQYYLVDVRTGEREFITKFDLNK
jgi:hypothetical protein